MIQLIKIVQRDSFSNELKYLRINSSVPRKSNLLQLHPFLDESGVIRVGGRLTAASIPYDHKHPIVLPSQHDFTTLLIRDCHYRNLHAGTQLLLATLRTRFWIISGKGAIKRVLRTCVLCFRHKPRFNSQIMSDLPGSRVIPARRFLNAGVDFGGPFTIKISRNKTTKAYLCIFICFATKAVHLEAVSDLSTHAFLNAFKRFIARRGKCHTLHSDNGTNFVGANKELESLAQWFTSQTTHSEIQNFLSDISVNWQFIPPRSPHFGGLWESAIKSAKYHIKRVANGASLSFEELSTLFTQIEACLNSRPICPLSSDPADLTPLTPGHFLIGEPLTALPHKDVPTAPANRYQLLTKMYSQFWSQWSQEYLSTLQQRPKWQVVAEPVRQGMMVILKNDNTPPQQWPLGRIVDTFPGKDGKIRVVLKQCLVKSNDQLVVFVYYRLSILPRP